MVAILAVTGGFDDGPPVIVARVGGPAAAPPIPNSFVGLSMEYQAAEAYTGPNSSDVDPVFEQLIRNLTPGQDPVLRIGGDSTDHTWVPTPGVARSPGVYYALTPDWLASVGALAHELDARLILGIDLEADSTTLASAEANALVNAVGADHVQGLEIGNEPSLYGSLAWYTAPGGRFVNGRPFSYDLADYVSEFTRFARVLPAVPLAGPALGSYVWMGGLGTLLSAEPSLKEVTFHRYPFDRCGTRPGSPRYPTVRKLLKARASDGLAETLAPYVQVARARGVAFRLDELGSVACAGSWGVSNTFASSLWMLDTLFAMARIGVAGVNVHTFPRAAYEPFTVTDSGGRWSASIEPDYYGMLMFVQAAPPGSQLLKISTGSRVVRAWATRGTAGVTRVVLINSSLTRKVDVVVRLPRSVRRGWLERLRGPSAYATSGVSLGGRSFPASTYTGVLPGPPHTTAVMPSGGSYRVSLPPTSAALLTVP